jgi:RNA polymerase subunit RPABC4/transcription elongation factor Spt4
MARQQSTRQRTLEVLRVQGFDHVEPRKGGYIYVGCSQCEALVINGVACHETGCPNATHECHGCNAIVPMRQKYCAECAS